MAHVGRSHMVHTQLAVHTKPTTECGIWCWSSVLGLPANMCVKPILAVGSVQVNFRSRQHDDVLMWVN